ncbi:UNVERIFIED_CONTAM: rhoptry protein ROP7, partial [Hammondia hammondi]
YSDDSTEGENTVSEEQAEGSRGGGSWLEQEGVELTAPSLVSQTGTSTPSPTGFRGLLSRLRLWRRGRTRGSEGTAEAPRRSQVPLHTRLLQHVRRVGRFIRHGIPAAAGRFFRRFWPGRPQPVFPVFTEGDPPDLDTNPLYYRGKVPGEEIIQEVFRRKPGIAPQPVSVTNVSGDEIISQALWAEGGVVEVVSELGQPGRQLLRGRRIGMIDAGMMFEATDQATGEKIAVLVGYTSSKPSAKDVDALRNEATAVGLFQRVKNPYLAHRYLRFLVPFDLVTIPGKPLIQQAKAHDDEGWVINLLFLLPPSQVGMELFLDELDGFPRGDRPLVDAARVYLTVQAVRLVAHLQDEGVVHGRILPNSFCLKRDGSLYLRDFGSLVRAGIQVVAPEFAEFSPPEVRSARRGRNRSPRETRMTYAIDAWSLGSTIYFIWCYTPPVTGPNVEFSITFLFRLCR